MPLRLPVRLRLFRRLAFFGCGLAALRAAAPADYDSLGSERAPDVVASETIHASDPRIRALFFEGAPYRGKPTRVFAWLGIPRLAPGETAPGIVLLHGGGGTAFESWVRVWVDRGYAAIAIDHFGSLPVPTNAKPRPRNPDGGPPGGSLAFNQLGEPAADQWPFQALTAASRALSLLRAEPGVDPERIGVTGISWGGYLTCVFAGVDHRLRFAVPVYGCGHYDDTVFAGVLAKRTAAEAAFWREHWDASRYLPKARLPMLWVNGTNDHFFWLPGWSRSYRDVPVELRTLALRVNMIHGHPPAGDPPEVLAFADSIVSGAAPLPRILRVERTDRAVAVAYASERPVVRAELHYTSDGSGEWKQREWKSLPAELTPGVARVTLPADAAVYFLNLHDERGLLVSTSHESLVAPSPPLKL